MMRGERGSVAVTVAVLLPLLLTTLAGVVQLGVARIVAARVAAAADLGTLAAVDDQDGGELIRSGSLRLAPDAASVARRYFSLNLSPLASHLVRSPDDIAARADVAVFASVPSVDPATGWPYDRPTVRILATVGIRLPGFGLLPDATNITVRAASAAR